MKKFYMIFAVCLLLLLLPAVIWFAQGEKQLSIAIIDKTVPDNSYREHLGITWLLNYLKIKNDTGNPFAASRDYYGFVPGEENGTSAMRPLPADYSGKDIIYIADTYGVYEDDLPRDEKGERAGARTTKVYGGLDMEEWESIDKRLMDDKPSLLIAEYNTFASPTTEEVRKSVTKRLGVEWKGWTGRYFDELDYTKNEDIPQWVIEEANDEWPYNGSGFLLVNDFDGSFLVLESEKHLTEGGVNVVFTDAGKKRLGTDGSHRYEYWFDIVTPRPGAEVLATYDWQLTASGKDFLAEHGIPSDFAAVVQTFAGQAETLYFAGDFNDIPTVPRFYQYKGLPSLYRAINAFSDDSFYWSVYVPLMKGAIAGFNKEESKPMKKHMRKAELQMPARIHDDKMEVLRDGKWEPITVKGVNMGMGKPGKFPGEASIEEDEYYRWFEAIGEMNANTIRVYTLHPPGFYRALKAYNETHDEPIYVMHGVWINEEQLEESLDAFEEKNLADFREEMKRIVNVVHGDADLDERLGHANGLYDADISEWVSAWMIGVEWYPFMVEGTNRKHQGIGEYDGTYFRTDGASPFEYWLAEQMDVLVSYEMETYNAIRPMSFTNWVTTDLLDHPADSSASEDIVSVNPNLIWTKGKMEEVGQFASYHVYPYYPDFLNYEKRYREFIDFRGEKNNYAAYLKDLHEAHRLPILIAEFGIPASRGKTHENPFGWNQGSMSEKEQGEVLTHLFEDILNEGMMGGLVFTWQDEWFKRTWNTMDYDNPDRRPFWSNYQTNEQYFGLMSFDRLKVKLDGNPDDWTTEPIYSKDDGALQKMFVDHDEQFLYIRLDVGDDLGTAEAKPILLFDTVPAQGNRSIEGMDGAKFKDGLEFIAKIDGAESRLLIDPYYDFHHYLYGKKLGLIPDVDRVMDSGTFIPIEYALNKEYTIPNENKTIPFTSYETGKLREGNGNPESSDYDSLADYHFEDGMLELRIPWLLIQSKDPSKKEFIGDLAKEGEKASVFIDGIGIGVLLADEKGKVFDSFPSVEEGNVGSLTRYTWENWDEPMHAERLKQSYYIMKEAFEGK